MPQQMRLFMEIKRREKRYFTKESGVFKTKRQLRSRNRLLYFLPLRPLNVFFPQHAGVKRKKGSAALSF